MQEPAEPCSSADFSFVHPTSGKKPPTVSISLLRTQHNFLKIGGYEMKERGEREERGRETGREGERILLAKVLLVVGIFGSANHVWRIPTFKSSGSVSCLQWSNTSRRWNRRRNYLRGKFIHVIKIIWTGFQLSCDSNTGVWKFRVSFHVIGDCKWNSPFEIHRK